MRVSKKAALFFTKMTIIVSNSFHATHIPTCCFQQRNHKCNYHTYIRPHTPPNHLNLSRHRSTMQGDHEDSPFGDHLKWSQSSDFSLSDDGYCLESGEDCLAFDELHLQLDSAEDLQAQRRVQLQTPPLSRPSPPLTPLLVPQPQPLTLHPFSPGLPLLLQHTAVSLSPLLPLLPRPTLTPLEVRQLEKDERTLDMDARMKHDGWAAKKRRVKPGFAHKYALKQEASKKRPRANGKWARTAS